MELRHLRVFRVVADELHFGRAALRLRVAQSAVSQTIKDLEDDVGAALFARDRRNVALTDAGRALLSSAESAFAVLDRGVADARRADSGDAGRLSLRFLSAASLTVLPQVVARFRSTHPDVEFDLGSGGSDDNRAALDAGVADVAFVALAPGDDEDDLVSFVVERSPVSLLVPRRHALARKQASSLADVDGAPVVVLRGERGVRERLDRAFAGAGVAPVVVVTVDDVASVVAFVAAGVGVGVVPAFVARHRKDVVAVPLRPALPSGVRALWHPRRLSPVAARFVAALQAAVNA